MTKLEINLNQQSHLLEKMLTATDAEDEALSAEMLALRERELDLREDEAMQGAGDDEAELEMYDDAPAFSIYEE